MEFKNHNFHVTDFRHETEVATPITRIKQLQLINSRCHFP